MIPLLYINLDEQVGRRRWFESHCFERGLKPQRRSAINGRKLSDQNLAEYRSKRLFNVQFGPAEIGCYLSHLSIWREISDGSDLWVFVAEDDLHFSTDAPDFFANSDWIPPDARLVKAESTFKKCHLGNGKQLPMKARALHPLLSLHGGGGGYFLHRDGARRLVKLSEAIAEPADFMLFAPGTGFFEKTNVYQIDPAIAVQDLFIEQGTTGLEKSDLDKERELYRPKSKTQKIWRELKRPVKQMGNWFKEQYRKLRWQTQFRMVSFAENPDEQGKFLRKRFL